MATPQVHPWAALPLALAVACSTDVQLPAGALIGCADASECPAGLVCHRGRCQPAEGLDTTPPDLAAAPSVSPAVGRAGADFEIVLESTEPLAEPPELSLRLIPPVAAPCVAEGGTWRCRYTATGEENGGLGGVVPFDVRLVDVAGNETSRRLAGALDLDFVAPALTAANASPAEAPLGGVVQVFFTTSEPLEGAALLRASRPLDHGGGPASSFPIAAAPGTLNHFFTHLVTPGDSPGDIDFTVEFTDLAGNTAVLPVGSVTVDNVLPEVSGLTVTPARIDGLGTVTATFDVSEPAADLAVDVGGRPMTCGAYSAASPSYRCTRPMVGDEIAPETEEAQSVLVELADTAGNRTQASGSVVFDFRPPAVATESVAYLPAAWNPLQAVARATVGTTVLVSVTADEALDPTSPPALSVPGSGLAFALVPGTLGTNGAVFEALAPSLPDGDYPLEVAWTDLAGNSVSRRLQAGFHVKTSTPVLAIDQASVTFVRAPWGVADVGEMVTSPPVPSGLPFAALAPADPLEAADRLPAATFAAPGEIAILRIWKDGAMSSLLVSRVLPGADGSWPRALVPGGEALPTVWVTAVDDAGNESAPRRLLNAEWIATGGRPAAGESPHAIHGSYDASTSLVPPPSVSEPRPPGPPSLGLVERAHTTLRPRFSATGAHPSTRTEFGVAFDAARGRTVLYGGQAPSGEPLADTWEWDGVSWSDVSPASGFGPGPAIRPLLAYDGARGRVVLEDRRYQVWEWDGEQWSRRWELGSCADTFGFMAYDAVRERIAVVPYFPGGSTTCEWDGTAWSTGSFGADPPFRLGGAAVAYDAHRGAMVFFGGADDTVSPAAPSDQLWERHGTVWSLVDQGGAVPGARVGHSLVFDPATGRVLLFGGADGAGTLHADVRAWDGASWTIVASPGPTPSPRRGAGAVMDAGRGRLVVHAGVTTGDAILEDTWELGPDGWEDVSAGRTVPAPRRDHAMAYDPLRGVTVLYGGADSTRVFGDVWEFDGHLWRDVTPPAGLPSPGPRLRHSMAFHSASGKLLVFGGWSGGNEVSDLWEWTGTAWVARTPTTSPPAREFAGLSDDPVRGVLVLLGGITFVPSYSHPSDLWELSVPGGVLTWNERTALPSGLPRSNHAQIFDGSRTLVLGGYKLTSGTVSDVWSYDGSTWTELLPDTPGSAGPPDTREGGVWDPVRARGILLGDPNQSWDPYRLEWDGAGFEVIRPTSTDRWPLDQRAYTAVSFDSRRGRAVIFGGADAASLTRLLGGTWELDADVEPSSTGQVQRRTPAVQMTVRYADGGFSEAQVQALRVRARAGGDVRPGVMGARLLGWVRGGTDNPGGRWVPLAENADPMPLGPSPEGLIEWSAAADLARFFRLRDRELAFQLRPAGAPGPSEPESAVQAEYLEVRVRYSAP